MNDIRCVILILVTLFYTADQLEWNRSRQAEKDIFDWVLNRTTLSYQPLNLREKNVRLNIYLFQIPEIDESQGTIRLKLFLDMYYHLNGMNWTEQFPNSPTEGLWLPSGTLWMPKFVFLDAIEIRYFDLGQHMSVDGYALVMYSLVIIKNTCTFKMRHFPFDSQVTLDFQKFIPCKNRARLSCKRMHSSCKILQDSCKVSIFLARILARKKFFLFSFSF